MKKVLILIFLLMILASLSGCTNKTDTDNVVGSWKAVSIECEEEDLKADVLAGNIVITVEVDDKNMTMSVNEYTDPSIAYTYKDGKLGFEEDFINGSVEEGKMILTVVFDEHTYVYYLEKVE